MEEDQNELTNVIKDISKTVNDLQPIVADINTCFESMYLELRPQYYANLSAKYTAAMSNLDKVIRDSQKALAISDGTYHIPRPDTPIQQKEIHTNQSQNSITVERSEKQSEKSNVQLLSHPPHQMFEEFKTRKLPISHLPYPGLCGSIPANDEVNISVDDFVVAKIEEDFVLCYVNNVKEDIYQVVDADSDEPFIIDKPKNECLPLPTSLPDRSTSYVEYPEGSTVLAPYPDGQGDWSSVFYKATVLVPPSKRDSGYELKFDEDTIDSVEVPVQFVAPFSL